MKTYKTFCLLLFLPFLFSCGQNSETWERVRFSKPFPKANKDLTQVLGENLRLKVDQDTLHLSIAFNQGQNLIKETTSGDTIFFGKVSKFRGLYYFNEQVNDSSFAIYAVKVKDNLLYGLASQWVQKINLDKEVSAGNLSTLIDYVAPDSSIILLHPDRKELKQLFGHLLSTIPPDTILPEKKVRKQSTSFLSSLVGTPEEEELSLVSSLYPNPVKDIVTVHLQEPGLVEYQVTNLQGQKVLEGTFKEVSTQVEMSRLTHGIYHFTLYKNGKKENLRVLKI